MMKLKAALLYRLQYQLKSLGIFYLYFILFTIIFPALGILLSHGSLEIQSDLTIPAMMFGMILAFVGIKTDFKFFIQNGMNRFHIFIANVITNFVISNVIVITMLLFRLFFKTFFNQSVNYSLLIIDQYVPKASILTYVLLLVLIFLTTTLGLVTGLFIDRFSVITRLIIGGAVFLSPFLLLSVFSSLSKTSGEIIVRKIGTILGISRQGLHVTPLIVTLIVMAVINLGITYLMNRRRQLQRIS